ncbi:MAG: hypothetical protein A3J47_01165 [Candidatus Yanofskybacteria bacterium RIFCSPHIGHO2_02_FULL_43_22]|uniref:Uncharacterized protein n=1 Tax=Candidatus Yanofskybacteria bacterium RIFCSPHIGHO2_02_FULL_43_22 TaxID=1802681 RepID=A0A1F8FIZ8_9BACT|nr:MAG: hypothetical protein A3J47_01165 [Candidatus Yanofskybacteria bacterium RIFCSPHIGHO2_02_FULL_43_22]
MDSGLERVYVSVKLAKLLPPLFLFDPLSLTFTLLPNQLAEVEPFFKISSILKNGSTQHA